MVNMRNDISIQEFLRQENGEKKYIRGWTMFFHFESFLITFDWLEKSLDRKPAPIEVIM